MPLQNRVTPTGDIIADPHRGLFTGNLGITGVSQNPFDWGLPNISLTNFGSINDTNPLLRRDQTWSFSDFMIWRRGRHTLRWGGDFRRIQLNTQASSNARGSFTFTGVNTTEVVNGKTLPGTGFDFADFEMAERNALSQLYPQHAGLIAELTWC